MYFPKKWTPAIAFFSFAALVWLFRNIKLQKHEWPGNSHKQKVAVHGPVITDFQPGTVKAVGEPYTKMLVIPRMKDEDVAWIDEFLGGDPLISQSIYTADDPSAELHPPKNKGNEVMIYLSYIIDHYDNLSDVNIFMHSHRYSWHNNDLLESDSVEIISRLSAERVQREGFMNLRCHWEPGCPNWMHPGTVEEDGNKQEETMLAKSWTEIFPLDPVPSVLAQPCCAQFAISRDRIQSIPLATFVYYRDWLLNTPLSDYISGRVWEYVWQFALTGKNILCPKENVCYCDGFGVCFGGEDKYDAYWEIVHERQRLEDELKDWTERKDKFLELTQVGKVNDANELGAPEEGKDQDLKERIEELRKESAAMKRAAKKRGSVAKNRAEEAGREWKEGDGF